MGIIRFLLAISVLLAHTTPLSDFQLVPGEVAVECFYIISGFYMSLALTTTYKTNLSSFYWNRFVKIFPIYWIILLFAILIYAYYYIFHPNLGSIFGHYQSLISHNGVFIVALLIIIQLIIFGMDLSLFTGIKDGKSLFLSSDFSTAPEKTYQLLFIPQSWSLSLELYFYLIVPFLNKIQWKKMAILIILILFSKYIFLGYLINKDPWTYRFFPFELAYFLLGMLSYKSIDFFKQINFEKYGKVFLFIIIILSFFFFKMAIPLEREIFYIFFVIALPFIFKTKLPNWVIFIGELSYPIYLLHFLVLQLVKWAHLPFQVGYSIIITVFGATLILVIQKKILKRFKREIISKTKE